IFFFRLITMYIMSGGTEEAMKFTLFSGIFRSLRIYLKIMIIIKMITLNKHLINHLSENRFNLSFST
ncbi:MAG: hypothetical protein ACK4UJ_11530, partial [Leptonema sp. (in: bacteria)]